MCYATANLPIGVKPQNEKSTNIFGGIKMGITEQAGQRDFFANRLEDAIQLTRELLSSTGWRSIKRLQVRLHSGVVDAQELGCTRHSIDVEVLALGPLFVHELKYGIVRGRVLEDRAGDHKQGFPQMKGAML